MSKPKGFHLTCVVCSAPYRHNDCYPVSDEVSCPREKLQVTPKQVENIVEAPAQDQWSVDTVLKRIRDASFRDFPVGGENAYIREHLQGLADAVQNKERARCVEIAERFAAVELDLQHIIESKIAECIASEILEEQPK